MLDFSWEQQYLCKSKRRAAFLLNLVSAIIMDEINPPPSAAWSFPQRIWDVLLTISITLAAIVIPFRLVIGVFPDDWLFEFFITVVFSLDIVVTFLKVKGKGTNPLKAYGTWSLTGDILAAVPLYFIPGAFWLMLLRLLKMPRVIHLMSRMRRMSAQNWGVLRLSFFVYWLFLSTHWLACGWLQLHGFSAAAAHDLMSGYIHSLYWVIQTLTSVGYGDELPSRTVEYIYAMSVMIFGVAVYGYVIGNVASILANIDPSRSRFVERMERLSAFIKYHNIPSHLQRRLREYYAYMWDKRLGYEESTVLAGLPPSLHTDVSLFLKRDIIQGVPFFQDANEELIRDIALSMKPVIYLPGDYVFRAGENGFVMYFISRGKLEVISSDGQRVYTTLSDGDFFGEIALLQSRPRTASVRAIDFCDLYSLDKTDLERILQSHPAFAAHIEERIKERQERGM